MDPSKLNALFSVFKKASALADWKSAIEVLATELRATMVFDNMAVYILEHGTHTAEVFFARALGRGKQAEADAAWGESLANQVITSGSLVMHTPARTSAPNTDRIGMSYLLGMPLHAGNQAHGAVVFIRFGGPLFNEEHLSMAALVSSWISHLFERRSWQETYSQLHEVQRRVRLQDDFMATISHELRTPLGFIKGYSTTLLRNDTQWDDETQREFLTIIDEETDRLSQLIEDLLESSRLQSNSIQFKFQPMRLDAMLRDAVIRAKQRQPNLAVTLDFGAVPPMQGDSVHLRRIFENLFNNALKYAPGSPLHINLNQEGESLHIQFSDEGPGIPSEFLEMIFERFYRVPDDERAANTGTGLGLYICRQIIAAHRGKIWAESTRGHGVTFHIELPIVATPSTSD